MKKKLISILLALGMPLSGAVIPSQVHAQSEASAALSLIPLASVVVTASAAGTAASAVAAAPAALSMGGVALAVVAVEASAGATIYVLERASDGARVSIRLLGRATRGASVAVGTFVEVSVIASGVVLSVAGEVLAFVPNAIGRALLHDERLS